MTSLALRILTAAGVLLSGGVHLWLWWYDGFRYITWIGPLFLLNAAASVVIALAVVLWRHWLPAFLAAGFGASTLVAFFLSATVGLLGIHETFWARPQLLALVSELVALVGGGVLLLRALGVRPGLTPRRVVSRDVGGPAPR
ncbi:MAG: hypothetical protein ACXVEU_11415 [Nocardioidaceae bacterium]